MLGSMGFVDVHSHLLPGVDDGVATFDEAVACVEGLIERGYDRIVITPHQNHRWRPSPLTLRRALDRLRDEGVRRGWPVWLALAAEHELDEVFIQRWRTGALADYAYPGAAVLVECSPLSQPPFLERLAFELRMTGLTPVLAHPERYSWLCTQVGKIAALRQAGFRFQIDVGSFCGAYGTVIRKQAERLLKESSIDLVATDLHAARQLAAVDAGWQMLRRIAAEPDYRHWGEVAPAVLIPRAPANAKKV